VGSTKISEAVLVMIPTETAFAPHRNSLQMRIRPKVERLSRNSVVKLEKPDFRYIETYTFPCLGTEISMCTSVSTGHHFNQTIIGNADLPIRCDQDAGWFEAAVNKSTLKARKRYQLPGITREP
jgi:hypothetical protein